MAVGLRQSLSLSQSLRMTPQLQQAIKLLQMSRLELETAVRKELEENPVLEESSEAPDPGDDMRDLGREEAQTRAEASGTEEASASEQNPQNQDEFDWDSYMESSLKSSSSMSSGGGNEEIMNYENLISSPTSLYDHLLWQVNLSGFSEEEQNLVGILCSYIDDDGYLKTPLTQIAEEENVSSQDLESVLPYLQELDPPGVGARTLEECLILQAQHLQEDTKDLVHLIHNHLKDLEKKNYDGIAKAMKMDISSVVEMCKTIYSMDPKPGRNFQPNETQYVTPDVYVYKVGDEYMVSLNEDGLPRLKISNFYKNILKSKPSSKGNSGAATASGGAADTRDYIQDKLRSAVWLIKSIHQRQRTIYKVTESIVKHQKEFFDKGSAFIKPMILRDIASDIGMHESTVSRVTNSKYMHTPRGIFELKYFFNSGISTSDGDAMASESVKLKIKQLVSEENPSDPLSDQEILEILKKQGIQIARRTVAKYRDMLKILPSSRRKKMF